MASTATASACAWGPWGDVASYEWRGCARCRMNASVGRLPNRSIIRHCRYCLCADWRVAGMSYNKYSVLCADMVRAALKPDVKAKAKLQEAIYYRSARWQDGVPQKQGALCGRNRAARMGGPSLAGYGLGVEAGVGDGAFATGGCTAR